MRIATSVWAMKAICQRRFGDRKDPCSWGIHESIKSIGYVNKNINRHTSRLTTNYTTDMLASKGERLAGH